MPRQAAAVHLALRATYNAHTHTHTHVAHAARNMQHTQQAFNNNLSGRMIRIGAHNLPLKRIKPNTRGNMYN